MNIPNLEKQIANYKRNKLQLEQLEKITENSIIAGITFKNDSTLSNIFLDNPEISIEDKREIITKVLQGISAWKEELIIDVSTFENLIGEIE